MKDYIIATQAPVNFDIVYQDSSHIITSLKGDLGKGQPFLSQKSYWNPCHLYESNSGGPS